MAASSKQGDGSFIPPRAALQKAGVPSLSGDGFKPFGVVARRAAPAWAAWAARAA